MNATAEVEVKFKGTCFVPVPINRQRHTIAERDAHEEEEAIRDYFSKAFSYNDILALLHNSYAMVLNIMAFK